MLSHIETYSLMPEQCQWVDFETRRYSTYQIYLLTCLNLGKALGVAVHSTTERVRSGESQSLSGKRTTATSSSRAVQV